MSSVVGRSAYEIALLHGFRGTQADWLKTLVGRKGESTKGDKGDQGDKGDPGRKGDKGDQGDKGDKGDAGQDAEVFRAPLFFDVIRDDEAQPIRLVPTYGQGKNRPELVPVRDPNGLMTRIDCV